jgi:hypothetical protein
MVTGITACRRSHPEIIAKIVLAGDQEGAKGASELRKRFDFDLDGFVWILIAEPQTCYSAMKNNPTVPPPSLNRQTEDSG